MQDQVVSYNLLIKNLKKNTDGFKKLKIAVLADFASQHYVKALKSALIDYRINAEIWEADYNSVEVTIYNEDSDLYKSTFNYVIIVPSVYRLNKEFSHSTDRSVFAEVFLARTESLLKVLKQRTNARIIFSNFQELDDGVFGNYANKTVYSFLYQLRKLNIGLMELAVKDAAIFVADIQSLYSRFGMSYAFDPKLYVHGDLIFSLDFLARVAVSTSSIIAAIQGDIKKCVILDLDNTLWGGIIGDDGIENIQVGDLGLGKAFTLLQTWLHDLKTRGIILAVCSKNTEAVAKEVFEKHPGMTLRLDDISVFVANWETKVDNILFIQSVLNIGFDSIVFLDDNPFEREIVRKHINGITVPDLPADPAEYLPYLQSLNLFETASFSGEDANRTRQYQEEAGRMELQKLFTSEDEFLASLNMTAIIQPVDLFTCPRVAQLTQRSNQFNLRTVRYTDEDIKKIMSGDVFFTLTVSLEDKYGDYGLISTVILQLKNNDTLFIDTWIMSCRVLKRGVESILLNEMVNLAREHGISIIQGEYLPTSKNNMVRDHYKNLGFKDSDFKDNYILDVNNYEFKINHIQKKGSYANS